MYFRSFSFVLVILTAGTLFAGTVLRLESGDLATDQSRPKLAGSRQSKNQIIQFKRPLNQAELAELRERTPFLRYVPDDAFIVRLGEQALPENLQLILNAIVPYAPKYKQASHLQIQNHLGDANEVSVQVRFFFQADIHDVLDSMISQRKIVLRSIDQSTVVLTAKPSVLYDLLEKEQVEYIDDAPAIEFHQIETSPAVEETQGPNLKGTENGTSLIHADFAWKQNLFGAGQAIGIADTGLDTGDVKTLSPEFAQLIPPEILGTGSSSWADVVGHGTHAAGLLAGLGVYSEFRLHGVATAAKLFMQSLFAPFEGRVETPSDKTSASLSQMWESAYQKGVRVHTNSWGSSTALPGEYTLTASEVDEFMWTHPDFLLVFSAGNRGRDINKDGLVDEMSVTSPATSKNCLTVGASKNFLLDGGWQDPIAQIPFLQKNFAGSPLASHFLSDDSESMAEFSSRGPTKDQRLKPDVVAPGTNILSVRSQMPQAPDLWGRYNSRYVFSGGTSMAAPLVAGSSALLREFLAREQGLANPSAALLKGVLMLSADRLAHEHTPHTRMDFGQGFGRLNLETALTGRWKFLDETEGPHAGDSPRKIVWTIPEKSKNEILLIYTDAPASRTAGVSLVNDLNLRGQTADKTTFLESNSDRNNFEYIAFESINSTTVEIEVSARNIPMDRGHGQPFALIYKSY